MFDANGERHVTHNEFSTASPPRAPMLEGDAVKSKSKRSDATFNAPRPEETCRYIMNVQLEYDADRKHNQFS